MSHILGSKTAVNLESTHKNAKDSLFNLDSKNLNSKKLKGSTNKTRLTLITAALLSAITATTIAAEEIESVKLERSVITATGFEQDVTLAPASISVIKGEEIRKSPARDLGEALRNIPGVSIDSSVTKTGGYGISIRGMPTAYTLILIDGKRTNGSGSGAFPNGFGDVVTSFMPPLDAIERIEVIRGPASTLYGSDAIGGVVNIITKKTLDKWSSSVSYDYTHQTNKAFGDTQNISLYTAGPLDEAKKYSLILRGKIGTRDYVPSTDLRIVPTVTGTTAAASRNNIVGLSYSKSQNLGARIGASFDEIHSGYLDLDYSKVYFDNSQGLLGSYTPPTAGQTEQSSQAANGYGKDYNVDKVNITAAHKAELVKGGEGKLSKLVMDSSIQLNQTRNDGRYVPNATFSTGTTSANGITAGDSREIYTQDLILDHKTNAGFSLSDDIGINATAGARYWYSVFNDNILKVTRGDSKSTQHIGALFAEGEFGLYDRLFITLGVRENYSNVFGSKITPRAYLSAIIIPELLTFKGGWASGYKSPDLNVLVNGVVNLSAQGQSHTYGNPDLKAESSDNFEASIISSNEFFDISVGGFHTTFKDRISSVSYSNGATVGNTGFTCSGANGCSLYVNVEKAVSYGLELSLSSKPVRLGDADISANLNYTLNKTKVTASNNAANIGERLTNVPLHSLNVALNYSTNTYGFYIQEEYRAGIYRSSEAERAALGEHYKPYYLTNIGANVNLKDGIRLNLAIQNLFDFDFADYQLYSGGTAIANNYNYIREGRRYYASVSYEF